jgi:glycine/D-amino acid oxidase-like deaminating enzyme
MNLISNHPYWPIRSGLLRSYPPLRTSIDCDVVVIGAGITGALCAYYLTREGFDVVVIDKRDVASGSTSASTALIQYEVDTHLTELRDRYGERRATRIYQACHKAVGQLRSLCESIEEPTFIWKPSVYLASRKRDVEGLREEHRARRAAGIDVEWLDRKAIESRFPFSRDAALSSDTAAEVDVYRLTHRLLEKAIERGARIYDRTAVELNAATSGGVTFTTPDKNFVHAKWAVFATGYEVVEMLDRSLVNLNSSFAFVSEPLEDHTGWWERCLIWETARPYLYLRFTVDGRIIVGGEDSRFRNPRARDALIPRKAAKLEKRFREMFPDIALEPAYAWAGTFGETRDGLPCIGTLPAWPRCFFSLGFGGNGIIYSLIAAGIATARLQGKRHPDATLFQFER